VRLQFGGIEPLESAAHTLRIAVEDPAALRALLARLDDAAVEVAG
jgi:hypothetical protein